MSQETNSSQGYVLGHERRELERLEKQAELFADTTRTILARAGVGPGMRVLDLGCGVGDVSRIAADLVGPEGRVLGVDISEDALSIARARLEAAGQTWAEFHHGGLEDLDDLSGYDAVVGRFILIHLPDPAAEIARIAARLKPGAVIAFAEFDISSAAARPPLPLFQRCVDWIVAVYQASQRDADTGTNSFHVFRAAGLSPQMIGLTRMSDGRDVAGFHFLTESVRSLVPAMEALGVASAAEVDIDSLHERLTAEAAAGEHCILYPRIVGAWARVG